MVRRAPRKNSEVPAKVDREIISDKNNGNVTCVQYIITMKQEILSVSIKIFLTIVK